MKTFNEFIQEMEKYDIKVSTEGNIIKFQNDDSIIGLNGDIVMDLLSELSIEEFVCIINEQFELTQDKDIFSIATKAISDFSYAQDHIFSCLINYSKNEEFLKDMPHIRILDMAIYFKIYFDTDRGPLISNVNHQMLDIWNITEEDLFKLPISSNPYNSPLFYDLFEEEDEAYIVCPRLLEGRRIIMTNASEFFGAGIIFNDEILKEIHRKNGDFYLKFQDTDTVVLSRIDDEALEFMLRGLPYELDNSSEYVSNNIYIYDGEKLDLAGVKRIIM